jgi:hypothetical protein
MIKRMDSEFSPGKVEIFIREGTRTMKEMGWERCTGLMEVCTKGNGELESNMEWER